MIELNKMTAIEATLDAIMNRMNTQEKRSHLVNEVGIVNGVEKNSVSNQGLAQEGPYQVKEVQYLNGNRSYNFKPNNNFPTHYTLALRNHENLLLWWWKSSRLKTNSELSTELHSTWIPRTKSRK